MKKKEIRIRASAIMLFIIGMLCSCGTDITEQSAENLPEEDDPAEVVAYDVSNDSPTRALAMELNSFAFSVYNMKRDKLFIDKLLMTKDPITKAFTGKSWSMLNTEMKAICVSPNMDVVTSLLFDKDNHSFVYEVPTTEQMMIKIGANMSFTKQSANNKLSIRFINSLATLTVRARNELELKDKDGNLLPVTIYVKSCTLCNMGSQGKFTYTGNVTGTWELIDGAYANYPQVLASTVEMSQTKFINICDSTFTMIPQSPETHAWTPAGTDEAPTTDAISVANANHKAYIILECAMTSVIDNQTVYVWGSETTFKPVYFPYKASCCPRAWNGINKQGVYNLKIVEGDALDAEGKPIKPEERENENNSFINAEFITVSPTTDNGEDDVDDWPDAIVEDITL